MSAFSLSELAAIIRSRTQTDASSSYTAQLLASGKSRCARKFGEEAVELIVASLDQSHEQIAAEAADVLYHLLVLLQASHVALSEVMDLLQQRTQQSGLQEKAQRGKK